MSSSAVGIITGVAAVAGAAYTGGASLSMLAAGTAEGATAVEGVMTGVAMAGGAMSAVGAATNNTSLEQMGAVAGMAGGLGMAGAGILSDPNTFLAGTTGTVDVNPATTDAAVATAQQNGVQALNDMQTAQDPLAAANTQAPVNSMNAPTNPASANLTAEQLNIDPSQQINDAVNNTNAMNADGTTGPQSVLNSNNIAGSGNNWQTAIPSGSAADAPLTGGTNVVTPPAGSNAEAVLNWAKGNPLASAELVKAGSGLLGGAMSYIAPSPIQKAQIAQQNAQTALLQQQYGQRAALNASINGVGPVGWNTNGVAPGSAGVAPPGAPPVASAQGFLAANMGGPSQPPGPTGNPAISAI